MSEWRDIKNAPKMRTLLLYAVTDVGDNGEIRNAKMATGFYHTGYEGDPKLSPWNWEGRQLKRYEIHPTDYKDLPAPPSVKEY